MLDDGACGFKAFLVPSGVDEFRHVSEADLRLALPVLAERGVPLLAHAELQLDGPLPGGDPRAYSTYLSTRPPAWENAAIRLLIGLGRETGAKVHIVHLSSAEALADIEPARDAGLGLTIETCPHYLTLTAETVPEGRTDFKCSPPIRDEANRERLWDALRRGVVDMVVSDHSPCVPERKGLEAGDFLAAWGGIASLELRLPVVWTEAQRRGCGIEELAPWLCARPAALAGLGRPQGEARGGVRRRSRGVGSRSQLRGSTGGAPPPSPLDALLRPAAPWSGRGDVPPGPGGLGARSLSTPSVRKPVEARRVIPLTAHRASPRVGCLN